MADAHAQAARPHGCPVDCGDHTGRWRDRRGMALLIVLLLLLALSSLAAAMLWIATTQNVTTSARARHAGLRLEAEAAALDAFARWQTPRPRHAVGESWVVRPESAADGATAVRAERLTTTLTLLRIGQERPAPGGLTAVMRVGLLIRTVQPGELLPSLPAALTAASATLSGGALVDADAPEAPPDGWFAADCPAEGAAALDSLFGGHLPGVAAPHTDAVRQDASSSVRGQPAVFVTPGATPPDEARLGPIPWDLVPQIADVTVGGAVHPAPAQTQAGCAVERLDNWGQPGGTGPCSRYAPVIYAPNGVTMTGGQGQGILVAHGDVTLQDDARFYGAVLASGRLLLRDNARIVGAARADSAILQGATLRYRVCPLWRAALGAPAFRRAFRPSGRWWLPDYPNAP